MWGPFDMRSDAESVWRDESELYRSSCCTRFTSSRRAPAALSLRETPAGQINRELDPPWIISLSLVLCFGLGIVLKRSGRLPDNAHAALNGFIINISLPALILL